MIFRYRSLLKKLKRLAHGSDCALYLENHAFYVFSDLRVFHDFSPLNPENHIPDTIPCVDFSDLPEQFSAVDYLLENGYLRKTARRIYRLTALGLHSGEISADRFFHEFIRSFFFPCLVALVTSFLVSLF